VKVRQKTLTEIPHLSRLSLSSEKGVDSADYFIVFCKLILTNSFDFRAEIVTTDEGVPKEEQELQHEVEQEQESGRDDEPHVEEEQLKEKEEEAVEDDVLEESLPEVSSASTTTAPSSLILARRSSVGPGTTTHTVSKCQYHAFISTCTSCVLTHTY
jgi:hypothetical protein